MGRRMARFLTHAPSTYKIPACSDRPIIFNVSLFEQGENSEETIHRSKAVGELPLMLGISVSALSDAIGVRRWRYLSCARCACYTGKIADARNRIRVFIG